MLARPRAAGAKGSPRRRGGSLSGVRAAASRGAGKRGAVRSAPPRRAPEQGPRRGARARLPLRIPRAAARVVVSPRCRGARGSKGHSNCISSSSSPGSGDQNWPLALVLGACRLGLPRDQRPYGVRIHPGREQALPGSSSCSHGAFPGLQGSLATWPGVVTSESDAIQPSHPLPYLRPSCCRGLNVCVSPRFICGSSNPHCDGIWSWSLGEVKLSWSH